MKTSILTQFATDAINAPAAVTGGTGCGNKSHGKSHKSRKSHKSHGSHSH